MSITTVTPPVSAGDLLRAAVGPDPLPGFHVPPHGTLSGSSISRATFPNTPSGVITGRDFMPVQDRFGAPIEV